MGQLTRSTTIMSTDTESTECFFASDGEEEGAEVLSSPIMNSKQCTIVQTSKFALRITSTLDAIVALDRLHRVLGVDSIRHLICVEKRGTTEQHFHAYIEIVNPEYLQLKKYRDLIINIFTVDVFKLGKGNKHYSLAYAKDSYKYERYVTKDGDEIRYKGYTELEIKNLKLQSYKKFSKNEFREKLNLIEDKYMGITGNDRVPGYYNIKSFTKDFIELKLEYKQNLNTNTLVGYIRMIYLRKNKDTTQAYANDIVKKATEIDY